MRSGQGEPSSEGLLAPLTRWLNDAMVSEILINQPQEVYIEKNGTFACHYIPELNSGTLKVLFQLIANENKKNLNESSPIISANLKDGARVQLVIPPVARHYTLSIRRQVVPNRTLSDYESSGFYEHTRAFQVLAKEEEACDVDERALLEAYHGRDWGAFIRRAIALKKNIVISGGTASGKTTYLNACLRCIPNNERIILLEDAREMVIPHPNQISLLARSGTEKIPPVSMQALVQCCLRLRPDRIIIGEIRGREVLDFLGACSTGHEGSLTSVHANNPHLALMRMTQLYKQNSVPAMTDETILAEINAVVDIIVQLKKTPQGRCVHSIYYKHGHLVDA